MITNPVETKTATVNRIQELVSQQWPEAVYTGAVTPGEFFPVTAPALQALFPAAGIPAGQLLEITGGLSSGKTGVLLQLLAGISRRAQVLYVDFARTFFPPSAASAGVALNQLLLLQPESLTAGMRTAELLLQEGKTQCVVFDLVGRNEKASQILLHRLRQLVLKNKAVALFLTEDGARTLPASLISLQLTVIRTGNRALEVVATKNRIGREGLKAELLVC